MKTKQNNGIEAEKKFVLSIEKRGISVKKSSRSQDMYEHWDFLVDGVHKVEVKGRKKNRQRDTEFNDDIIYVEFRNVMGYEGWLYGEADFIAFEREDGFLWVTRIDLMNLAERLVQREWVNRPTLYKKYKRRDRPYECVTILKIEDIMELPHRIFPK